MSRFIELRVHGVSGTSAESLLKVKEVTDPPVAGDKYVRFVRPIGEQTDNGKKGEKAGELEGMIWGRLTSGSLIEVTWLLLLPFTLVNLAYWARPWESTALQPGHIVWSPVPSGCRSPPPWCSRRLLHQWT